MERWLGWCLTPLSTIIISAISWQSALLMEQPGVPRESHRLPQVIDKLYHIMLYRVHLAMNGDRTHNFGAIGTDCTGTCICNYHTITTMTVPSWKGNRLLKIWTIGCLQVVQF